eukprot:scaffold4151_cov106-Isochrysis_galbana.AAC.4
MEGGFPAHIRACHNRAETMRRDGEGGERGCEPRRRTEAGGESIYAYTLHLCQARIGRARTILGLALPRDMEQAGL